METVSVSVETLAAGLSMHQGHGLRATNKAQTWHCSMQQHAGDEDSQSTSLTCKKGSLRQYQHSSREPFVFLLILAKQKKEEIFT